MKIKFVIENDVSVLKDKNFNYDYYLDSYLELFIEDSKQESLLLSTTMHNTILIALCDILIELNKNGKKQTLETFGNPNTYTFEKSSSNISITNFDKFSNQVECKYTFNLVEFTNSYIKEITSYLDLMENTECNIAKHSNYVLLKEKLNVLINVGQQ